MSVTDRRFLLVGVLGIFAIALALRTVPLYWSPLPSTLDGFLYAALAQDSLGGGHLPIAPDVRADTFVLTTSVAVTSLVTGVRPVHAIQPTVSVIGTATVIAAIAITRRLGSSLNWQPKDVQCAAIATGLLLAVQGLFLRRTTVAHPEVAGLLFGLLAVVALYRVLDLTGPTHRWLVVLSLLLVTFPILHKFSSFMAAMALTALVTAVLARRPSHRVLLLGVLVVGLFWTVSLGYYELVERLGLLNVIYVERISSRPGLFLAWVVAMVMGVAWYQSTTKRAMRAAFLLPVGLGLLIVAMNAVSPVFPGTITSPPIIVALLLPLAIPIAYAGVTAPALHARHRHAPVVLALIAAPVAVSYYSLSADLTPDFFATVMRAQTFAHVPVFVLTGLAVASVIRTRSAVVGAVPVKTILLVVLAVATLITVPLAFVTLDTAHFPATTASSEFQATAFTTTHVDEPWTSDQPATRIARQYFGAGGASLGPTRAWLAGGATPECSVLSLESWSTHGAHFWPAQPRTLSESAYESFLRERHLVYSNSGRDPLALTLPPSRVGHGC